MHSATGKNRFEVEGAAGRVARLFWRTLPREIRPSLEMLAALRLVNQEERDSFARCAGVDSPSDEVWSRVCSIVAGYVHDERHYLGLDERAAS